jgi:Bacterial Ig-like domain (group 2)
MNLRHTGLLLWAGLLPLSGCRLFETTATEPCLEGSYLQLRALPIGDSVTLAMGTSHVNDSDCQTDPEAAKAWTWRTADTAIVRVTTTGVVTGLKPGTFSVTATNGNQTRQTEGFIMPKDWTVAVEPATATVKVGESVTFQVVTYDQQHRQLPQLPFSIHTSEVFPPPTQKASSDTGSASRTEQKPLVDKGSQQHVTGPATFRATRPGVAKMIGEVGIYGSNGFKSAEATLTIVP